MATPKLTSKVHHLRKLLPWASFMGANGSLLNDREDSIPSTERYLGLVNFGNTCYCNSVLQALYYCKPFREKVLEYKASDSYWRWKRNIFADVRWPANFDDVLTLTDHFHVELLS